MNVAIAFVSVAMFVVAFRYARIVPAAQVAIARVRGALDILTNRSASEDEKERAAREAAVVLFKRFLVITGLSALALIPSVVSVAAAVWFGLADAGGIVGALLSPWLLVAGAVLFALDYALHR